MLTWLKAKLFNQTFAVVGPILAMILVLLLANSDTLLTKMGFETKTALAKEVAALRMEVEQLKQANRGLQMAQKVVSENCDVQVATIANYGVERVSAANKVDAILGDYQRELERVKQEMQIEIDHYVPDRILDRSGIPSDADLGLSSPTAKKITSVSPPEVKQKTHQDKLSHANITALSKTYMTLFGAPT